MKNLILILGSFLFITQCASLGGRYDKEKVEKVRKIAIVGFSYDAPLETSDHLMSALSGKEHSAGPGLMAGQKAEHAEDETPESKAVYDHLALSLKKVGWRVKSAAEVKAAPSVKAYFNKAVKMGFLPLQQGHGRFEREGIPQYAHVAGLAGKQEFKKMAQDLGVDAVAVAYVQAKGSQSIPLVTKINHSAAVTIQVFDPTADELILLFSSNGKEIEGTTKTKIGQEFTAGVKKGSLASIDQFAEDLSARLKN